MKLELIHILSMNPHFMSRLIQAFLCGYGETCSVLKMFLAMPVLYHEASRNKLITANKVSRLESLYAGYAGRIKLPDGESISTQSQVAGFCERYDILLPHVKQAVIVGCNEGNILFSPDNQISSIRKIDYKDKSLTKDVSNWIRAAYYLGIVFKKATPEELAHILGVKLP